ncbi:18S rRNA maturation protein [Coemansia sp. RSA 455]|nr:18S rRNA maturation protein [Coemansia sp. S17]KAJ2105622.1 18S rRNA maturation protein [Coemansia sp. S142-1]KAJ2247242.1 18S rRNA maturation protein [Coemansia sp. RSA 455]
MPKVNLPASVFPAKNKPYVNTTNSKQQPGTSAGGAPGGSGSKRSSSKRPKKDDDSESPMPTSISQCKKQLRDATRLLTRPTLASTKRQEVERRVKALGILQDQLTGAKVDKANASRYSGVKFIERKKVIRKLEKLEKAGRQQSPSDDEAKPAKTESLNELLVSLNYTTYYPDQIKYISLFPADPTRTSDETRAKQQQIRESIRLAMESGSLPKDPRLVSLEDAKAIKKSNKLMLRTVSLAHGLKDGGSDEGEDDDDEEGDNDDDEFFA